jgi:hypothetical protein
MANGKPTPTTGNPCIEITPTPAEYEQLCRDLKTLRSAGAMSNTSAILEAVRVAAKGHMLNGDQSKRRAARTRPRHGTRRKPDARAA